MLHKLTSWEDNGYHDSYFYISVWDDEKREVRAIQTGATAYAGGPGDNSPEWPAISDPAVLADAIAWLADHIYNVIRAAEYRDVLEPQAVEHGANIVLIRNVKHKGVTYPVGLAGDVFWSGAYGQFYAKGYNRPERNNIRVGMRLPNGDRIFVALNAVRLARDPMSDAELRERAERLAQECQFSKATGEKHAWDSDNYALALNRKRQLNVIAA